MTDAETTSRGWKRKKYYLSDEAVALLVAHCKGTPLTMSAYLDGLIKDQLAPHEEVRKVIDEGQRQFADLTSVMTPAELQLREEEKRELLGPAIDPAKVNPRIVIEPKQPTKKDFDIDL